MCHWNRSVVSPQAAVPYSHSTELRERKSPILGVWTMRKWWGWGNARRRRKRFDVRGSVFCGCDAYFLNVEINISSLCKWCRHPLGQSVMSKQTPRRPRVRQSSFIKATRKSVRGGCDGSDKLLDIMQLSWWLCCHPSDQTFQALKMLE